MSTVVTHVLHVARDDTIGKLKNIALNITLSVHTGSMTRKHNKRMTLAKFEELVKSDGTFIQNFRESIIKLLRYKLAIYSRPDMLPVPPVPRDQEGGGAGGGGGKKRKNQRSDRDRDRDSVDGGPHPRRPRTRR